MSSWFMLGKKDRALQDDAEMYHKDISEHGGKHGQPTFISSQVALTRPQHDILKPFGSVQKIDINEEEDNGKDQVDLTNSEQKEEEPFSTPAKKRNSRKLNKSNDYTPPGYVKDSSQRAGNNFVQ